jgi:hypothetical protein
MCACTPFCTCSVHVRCGVCVCVCVCTYVSMYVCVCVSVCMYVRATYCRASREPLDEHIQGIGRPLVGLVAVPKKDSMCLCVYV